MPRVNEPSELTDFPEVLEQYAPFGPYRAVISRVVDGDTLYCLLDLGFNTYSYQSIRVRGIDTPEIYSGSQEERTRGQGAVRHLTGIIAHHGSHILLYSEKWPQTFGRYVASVWFPDPDGEVPKDLGDMMVDAGHAVRSEPP